MTEQPPTAPASTPPPTRSSPVGDRPTGVTAASAILAILGVVTLLLGIVLLLFTSAAGNYIPAGVNPDVLGTGAAISGIFYVLFGIAQLAAAIFAWGGRDLGRLIGLVAAAIGLVVTILGAVGILIGGDPNDPNRTVAIVIWIVLILGYALAFYALWKNTDWFKSVARP